jgi:four helix bundle protein
MPVQSTRRELGERTFQFACDVVQFCRQLSCEPGVARQIAWQLADAGTSVAANYEEAKGSYSRREFAAKNAIVLKEAREARLWLRVILACDLAQNPDGVRRLLQEANELVGIFTVGVRRLRLPQALTPVLVLLTALAILVLSFRF